jgi:hypothetical protein
MSLEHKVDTCARAQQALTLLRRAQQEAVQALRDMGRAFDVAPEFDVERWLAVEAGYAAWYLERDGDGEYDFRAFEDRARLLADLGRTLAIARHLPSRGDVEGVELDPEVAKEVAKFAAERADRVAAGNHA